MAILRVERLYAGESVAVDDDAELLDTKFIKGGKDVDPSFLVLISEDDDEDVDALFAGLGGED